MYTELPAVESSTPAERLQALKDARDLVAGEPTRGGLAAAFTGSDAKGAGVGSARALIRLAEYITTGHDYRDSHPTGEMFREVLELRRFQRKEHEKSHAGHAHVGVLQIPKELAEMLLAGGIDIDEVIEQLMKAAESDERPENDPSND